MEEQQNNSKFRIWISALSPVFLLLILLLVFVKFGPLGVFKSSVPPIEKAFIQRVVFSPEHMELEVFNDGPEPVTIAQVLVNDAYWQFEMLPSNTLNPLEKGKIEIDYPWNDGDFEKITLISRNGFTFEKEVDVATLTPSFNVFYLKTFALLGIYVGIIPVLIGLLWFPFLKMLRLKWYSFLLSLTIGLLVFLGFDALAESFELAGTLPAAFNGIGILLIGFLLAVLALSAVSYKTQRHTKEKGEHYQALMWGYLIALGIGLHNLGEGLAIGSAYAVGEIALGSLLVIGFMVHNVTEGVAIVVPLTKTFKQIKNFLLHLIVMGVIAGAPTIIGTLIGGFAFSAALGVFFLAIGSGAIFDVSFDILEQMAKGQWLSIFTVTNVLGFLVGLLVMYLTGFLVV
ncbi:ZIP family metal transporter [Candidatus Woesearchaeota archaeon]|nr:ZIP family metal transporter [Candidatus Woesearchaeota archaeon]